MTTRVSADEAKALFERHFGAPPLAVASAPGRVNLIGEHTDYNLGFVLPMAIERRTFVAAGPRADARWHFEAADLSRHCGLAADHAGRVPEEPWADYVLGVLKEWRAVGPAVGGLNVLITGDVPVGCGLSSSAALEMAALKALEGLAGIELDGADAARLGQRVENNFLGLNSGIMDQYVSRNARAGHALLLDCRSFEARHVPLALEDMVFVVANTRSPRKLTGSKYNERVEECRSALGHLAHPCGRPLAKSLRDLDGADLPAGQAACPETLFRRARHVVAENTRTLRAAEALKLGDAEELGALMNASHASLRDDYEVTGRELDVMTAIARRLPGCHGARMTGAGFGGCTVNLVARRHAHEFIELLLEEYEAQTGLCGEAFITGADAGARAE